MRRAWEKADTMSLAVQHVLSIPEIIGERHLVTVTVSPTGEPILLSLEQPPDYRTATAGASFTKLRADRPNAYTIHHRIAPDVVVTIDLPATEENFHHVQPVGANEWLLVRGRASDARDRNAHLYTSEGQQLASFHAGDGIQDVQVADAGSIWVSYFDEGVFGDTELGNAGLVCFDAAGEALFRYSEEASRHALESIADCYALNVGLGGEVWLLYYTGFPLVQLKDRRFIRQWADLPIKGAHAFAVHGHSALFTGGYGEKGRLYLVLLDSGHVQALQPIDELGNVLQYLLAFGRGRRLFLQTESQLYLAEI